MGKVPVQGARTELCRLRNFIHARGLHTLLGKELSRRSEQTLAIVGGVAPLTTLRSLSLRHYLRHAHSSCSCFLMVHGCLS
jgi:hypothetical protein